MSKHGWHRRLLVARAELDSADFNLGEEHASARFVTREELLDLPYRDASDDVVTEFVDMIWTTDA